MSRLQTAETSTAVPAGSPGHNAVRVLHVITRLIVGGAMENTLLTAIGQHRDPRFTVTLLAGVDRGPEGSLDQQARATGLHLVLSKHLTRRIHPWRDLLALVELTRFMRRGRYQIVHTHTTKAGVIGRLAARLAGVPVVVHTLHSLVFHAYQRPWVNWLYVRIKRLCAPLTGQYISVCEATRRGALEKGIGAPERHATVLSGFDLEPFLEAEARCGVGAARARFDLPADRPVVGKVARLFPFKGHDHFIDMASLLHARRPDLHFLVIGDGVLRDRLEGEVRARGLGDVFRFAGLIAPEEIPAALVAMDVVVHTSLREGIARVLPQALAVGRPVVTFALDGAPEVIEHGRSGYTVAPLDTGMLAERVAELLDDPERRRFFARHGREVVMQRFSTARMVSEINALYALRLRERGILLEQAPVR